MSEIIEFLVFQGKMEKYECKCEKIDIYYNKSDSRHWSALINRGKENIIVTHCVNKYEYGDSFFDILYSGKPMLDLDTEDIYQTIESLIQTPTK